VGCGDSVAPFEHNGNMLGYALFDCEDAKAYEATAKKIMDALAIVVE